MSRILEPTFKVTPATMGARRLAKINTSATGAAPAKISICGVTGIPHCVTRMSGVTGDLISVDMFPFGRNGTYEVEVTISTAINVGTALYCAAGGRLTDHATTNAYLVAVAVQQAAASGDHIQVIPNPIVTFATTT